MSKPNFLLIIDEERCKGCELCVEFCPKGVLALASGLNRFGHHPATVVRQEDCTGCLACVVMCPDACIELYRRKGAASKAGKAAG